MSLFHELKRRNVLRMGAAYVVVSWVIIEVVVTLRELFPDTPLWLGQALIVLLVLGIVPVLVFSWFYELTPDGFKRDEDAQGDRSYSDAVGRRLIYVTIAGVIVGLALFAWTRTGVEPGIEVAPQGVADSVATNSVAVMNFANLSDISGNEYFSEGLAETLRDTLSKVENLQVSPRRTSVQIADLSLQDIHSRLKIAHVVEGSVQRSSDRVRVIAQLVRTSDSETIWSQNFDRDIGDIFAVQDDIASIVAKELLTRIGYVDANPQLTVVDTDSPEAYDLYLRALDKGRAFSVTDTNEAIRYLREALAVDPGFVDAKIELGWMLIQTLRIDTEPKWAAVFADVEVLAQQVLKEDSGNVTARYFLVVVEHAGRVLAGDTGMWPEFRSRYRALIAEAAGTAPMMAHFATVLRIYNEYDEASEILESLAATDPLNPSLHTQLAELYMWAGDCKKVETSARRAIELGDNSTRAIAVLGQCAMLEADIVKFLDSWLHGWELDPSDQDFPSAIADTLYDLGFIEEGDWFRDRVQVIGPNSVAAKSLGIQRAIVTGDVESATAMAKQAVEENFPRSSYWFRSVVFLLCNAVDADEAAEVMQLVDTRLPGFAELDNTSIGRGPTFVRIECLTSLMGTYSASELSAAVEGAWRYVNETVYTTAPQIPIRLLVHEGKTALAVEEALVWLFNRPLTYALWFNIRWRELLADPAMAEVAADPRIQRELQRWELEETELRKTVSAYFNTRPELFK